MGTHTESLGSLSVVTARPEYLEEARFPTQLQLRLLDNPCMKPIVLTHNLLDGSWTERAPIIITWDGLVTPQELHKVQPGQYVLLPYQPPPEEPPPPSRLAA